MKDILCLVAHPDDETLWAGGSIIRYIMLGRQVTVICCSIPRRPSEIMRAYEYFEACRILGAFAKLFPYTETGPSEHLPIRITPKELNQYKLILTHGPKGEYGHQHHKDLFQFVRINAKVPFHTFGFGGGDVKIPLTATVFSQKMAALKCYQAHMTGQSKVEALKKRYPICVSQVETFDIWEPPHV